VPVEGDQRLDRLLEVLVDRVERPADRDVALLLDVALEEPGGGVHAEVGERVHALGGQRPEDRGVGERVAVDLERDHVG